MNNKIAQQNCTTKGHNQAAQKHAQKSCAPKLHNKGAQQS